MTRSDSSVTLRCKVTLTRAARGRKVVASERVSEASPKPPAGPRSVIDPSAVPKLTRALVLGHHLERLVRDGIVQDYTQLARRVGLSKARITQLTNLTLLAPDIQNRILRLTTPESPRLSEHNLRCVAALADWNHQRAAFTIAHR